MLSTGKLDCRIGPTLADIDQHATDCFITYVRSVFQCSDTPTFKLGETKVSDKVCNSFIPGVTFSNADFNAFSEDIKQALTDSQVSDADIKSVAPAFEGMRLKLVGGDVEANKYTECAPNCQKGGDACLRDAGINDAGPKDTGTKDTGTPPQDAADDGG